MKQDTSVPHVLRFLHSAISPRRLKGPEHYDKLLFQADQSLSFTKRSIAYNDVNAKDGSIKCNVILIDLTVRID